jgi:hypothetical protein
MDNPAAPWAALNVELVDAATFSTYTAAGSQADYIDATAPPPTLLIEQPCPRNFWLTRAAKRVLAPAWVVPTLFLSQFTDGVIQATCPQVMYGGFEACSLADAPPLLIVREACGGGLGGIAVVGAVASLRRLLVTPLPAGGGTGPLERLGAQTGWMVLAPPRGQSLLVAMAQGYELRRWAQLLGLIAALQAPLQLVYDAIYSGIYLFQNGNWLAAVHMVGSGAANGVAIPLALAWWLTLKQAAALATHEVRVVRCAVHRCAASSEAWEAEVVQGCKALAECTLVTLSAGWAGGAAAVCVATWAVALGNIAGALRQQELAKLAVALLGPALLACLPAALLWDLADASSECDLLVKDLNDKRLKDPSDATHVTIVKLETMLGQLNKNQGLGFVLFGVVLDKRYFFGLLMKLGALAITVITTLLAFRHNSNSDGGGCGLSEQQQTTAQDMFTSFNASCGWNVTVNGLPLF